eukprot:762553-Hanusia_phi.AAC.2
MSDVKAENAGQAGGQQAEVELEDVTEFLKTIEIGRRWKVRLCHSKCTAFDERDGMWYDAKVIAMDGTNGTNQVKIHFQRWSSKFDSWKDLDSLKPPKKVALLPKLPTVESIEVVEVQSKHATFKIEYPKDVEGFQAFQAKVNGTMDPIKLLPKENDLYLFKGLDQLTKYTFTFRAIGKQKQRQGDWSHEISFETPSAESEQENQEAERLAKIKAEQKVMKSQVKDEKDEKEAEERKQKNRTKNHDYHCDVCLGWEGTLVCCDGSCRRSFHPSCVGLDEEENDENETWFCPLCSKGRKKCMICQDSTDDQNMIHCKNQACKKYFHRDCLKEWNCEVDAAGKFICPRHTCKGCNQRSSDARQSVQGDSCGKFVQVIPDRRRHMLLPDRPYRSNSIVYDWPSEPPKSEYWSFMNISLKFQVPTPFQYVPICPQKQEIMQETNQHPTGELMMRGSSCCNSDIHSLLKRNLYTMGKPKIIKEDITVCSCKLHDRSQSSSLPESQAAKQPHQFPTGTCGDQCENRLTHFECLARSASRRISSLRVIRFTAFAMRIASTSGFRRGFILVSSCSRLALVLQPLLSSACRLPSLLRSSLDFPLMCSTSLTLLPLGPCLPPACLLPPASCLLPPTSHLTSYRLPATSYLVPRTSFLLPPTSYLLPRTSYLVPPTSYLVPRTSTSYLLPRTSYLVPPTSYLPPRTSYLVPRTSFLPLACVLRPASCVLRPASCVLRPASCVLRPASCVLRPASCLPPLRDVFRALSSCSFAPLPLFAFACQEGRRSAVSSECLRGDSSKEEAGEVLSPLPSSSSLSPFSAPLARSYERVSADRVRQGLIGPREDAIAVYMSSRAHPAQHEMFVLI